MLRTRKGEGEATRAASCCIWRRAAIDLGKWPFGTRGDSEDASGKGTLASVIDRFVKVPSSVPTFWERPGEWEG